MKIYNHDITLYTHDREVRSELYAARALGLTHPDDKIQLPQALQSEWEAIVSHYAQIGLEHTHDVIWNTSVEEMLKYPDYEISVYFFGDVISSDDKNRNIFRKWDARYCEVIEFINSKNNFIQLSEELDIPVPKTLRFKDLDAAKDCDEITFPCYVKPAVSDHGFGIKRCPDSATLAQALAQLNPEEPLQIQAEVQASAFLNMQYQVVSGGVEPLLVSEQILDGCVHGGNRYPAGHEPWEKIAPFAEWMGKHGMKDIFAVDVAVVPEADGVHYVAIECNPRFNGSSYPTIVAKRLNIPAWISTNYITRLRSLKDLNLNDLAYDADTGKGVIVVNWGTILTGDLNVLIAGNEAEQAAIEAELQSRLQ